MSLTGLCQVCEAATASHVCDRCGRAVCDDHWAETTRACSGCAAGRGRSRSAGDRRGAGAPPIASPR